MKPASSPIPSGDRTIARALLAALRRAGFDTRVACRISTFDRHGDEVRQTRLARLCQHETGRIQARWKRAAWRPDLWLTYHLYDRAPDWIGPAMARHYAIPYVIIEASLAPSRAQGRWRIGYDQVLAALGQAHCVLGINPADRACVQGVLTDPENYADLPMFLADSAHPPLPGARKALRAGLARTWGLKQRRIWLVSSAMMRTGIKDESYALIACALARLKRRDLKAFSLLVAGDGPLGPVIRKRLRASMARHGSSIRFFGVCAPGRLRALLRSGDVFVWPAVRETLGMAFMEAKAYGMPAIIGATPGTKRIAAMGGGTHLIEPSAHSLAHALRLWLRSPASLARARAQARKRAGAFSLERGGARLTSRLRHLVRDVPPPSPR